MNRWSLFIDIDGFSKIYSKDMVYAVKPLNALMQCIYYIGEKCCPETPYRLFVHQIGDGFIIVSEFAERCPEFPLAIGIFLMRSILSAGGIGKCAISQGEFADIQGCYPEVIRKNADNSGNLFIGRGTMRIFPVMGTALINAYRLSKSESGALLIVDKELPGSFPDSIFITKTFNNYYIIDWVHSYIKEIEEIEEKTGIKHPESLVLEKRLNKYIELNKSVLPCKWLKNTIELNKC